MIACCYRTMSLDRITIVARLLKHSKPIEKFSPWKYGIVSCIVPCFFRNFSRWSFFLELSSMGDSVVEAVHFPHLFYCILVDGKSLKTIDLIKDCSKCKYTHLFTSVLVRVHVVHRRCEKKNRFLLACRRSLFLPRGNWSVGCLCSGKILIQQDIGCCCGGERHGGGGELSVLTVSVVSVFVTGNCLLYRQCRWCRCWRQ